MRVILSADDVIYLDESIRKDGSADQQEWDKDTRFVHTSNDNLDQRPVNTVTCDARLPL
jgi:hypothetical protein